MKTQSLLLALSVAPATFAHTVWTTLWVDGVSQGDGVGMRMRRDPETAGSPLEDLSSPDLACNVDGAKGVSRVLPAKDGSTLTFEFRSWPDDTSKIRLDRGHYGPCAVYAKKVDSAIDDQGAGPGWFKLWDEGYDAGTKQWCTDKMIDNQGKMSIALPKGLKGGYYLFRPEILALHNAFKGDPQFYAGCAQVYLDSTGNLGPDSTVSIPGYVKAGEKSVSFNIYDTDNSTYEMPGPVVANLVSSGVQANARIQTSQTEGLKPAGCIVENANWCAKEVSSYSDETGCWNANKECWKEVEDCYNSAKKEPTGNAGCKIMENKCNGIQNTCNTKNFNGPPNKDKDLNPPASTMNVGNLQPTHYANGGSPPKSASAVEKGNAAPSSAIPSSPATSTPAAKKNEGNEPEAIVFPTQLPGKQPIETGKASGTTDQLSIPTSETAPQPTEKADGKTCPKGYRCVFSTTTIVETAVQYVTVYADKRSVQGRRHAMRV